MDFFTQVSNLILQSTSKFKLYSVVAICASVFPFHVVLVLVLSLAG